MADMKTPDRIDPNTLKTRDPFLLRIIEGVTKAGVHQDQRKERNRKACRGRVREED